MSAALEQVADLIRRESGISLGEAQRSALEAALRRVDPAMDATAFLRGYANGDGGRAELLDRLIDEVTVNETFLFRQRDEFDAIDWRQLLEGARSAGRETIRVWVAACASGEEAYTLAVLASEVFAPSSPPVSIVATDISLAVLDKARRGCYGRRRVRHLEPEAHERYFVPAGDGVAVARQVRDLVEFRRHNLVSDPLPPPGVGSFDLITCRNVLIYFDGEAVEQVIRSLERGLAPGGMLLLGAADRLCRSAGRLATPEEVEPRRPRPWGSAPKPVPRSPLGREPARPEAELAVALQAANEGSLGTALEVTERMLQADPLDADAHFVRGLAELSGGDPVAAIGSLRRTLYVDPRYAPAAFLLGRAHEQLTDGTAAGRAYEHALKTLEPGDGRQEAMIAQVDLGDVAAACAIRLKVLRELA